MIAYEIREKKKQKKKRESDKYRSRNNRANYKRIFDRNEKKKRQKHRGRVGQYS